MARTGRARDRGQGQGGERCRKGREEEGLDPGQAKPGVSAPGRGAACPVSSAPSVCPQELFAVFHSIRLAGLPRASCPLGSLSMSGGGGQWRKQLQE